jgi:hypothetical protein
VTKFAAFIQAQVAALAAGAALDLTSLETKLQQALAAP